MASVAFAVVVTGLSVLLGCEVQSPPAKKSPLKLSKTPSSMTVKQRSTSAVSGSNGQLQLTVDDITGGQVIASLARADGKAILAPASMKSGDVRTFKLGSQEYQLRLVALQNELVGADSGEFEISLPSKMTETKKIELLIETVERMEGAKFIRNGVEHETAEAAEHLRRKWKAAGDRIKTADDFIEHLASKSSTTGKPYEIRLPDGSVVASGPYLQERLREIQEPPPPKRP
jgi:hypothetical protein